MSSDILLGVRDNGLVRWFSTTSGGLRHLYNPLLYAGEDLAWQRFEQRALDPLTTEPTLLAGGVVAIDFDRKVQVDCQCARDMRVLSITEPRCLEHFALWKQRGELSPLLWSPSGYPPIEVAELKLSCIRAAQDAYLERLGFHSDDELSMITQDLIPQVHIQPAGWQLVSFNPSEIHLATELLRCTGWPDLGPQTEP